MRQQLVPRAGVVAADATRILDLVLCDELAIYDIESRQQAIDTVQQRNRVKTGGCVNTRHNKHPYNAAITKQGNVINAAKCNAIQR